MKQKNTFCSFPVIWLLIGALLVNLGSCSSKAGAPRIKLMSIEKKDMSLAAPEPAQDQDTDKEFNTEEYDYIVENPFKSVRQNPLSTFSIDVDTASYSNLRRFLEEGVLPPKDAVRIEELINYFDYDYPAPQDQHPFAVITEVAGCPWNRENRLIHIGLQGKRLDYNDLKPSNLVFLIDSSGSMSDENKLPLLKKALGLLLDQLGTEDRVTIVSYAGSAGLVLSATPATEKKKILAALGKLEAGGSTAGGEGIVLAYEAALQSLIATGNNRVILCTDGDFNVGTSSTGDLVRLIEEKRQSGVYLTICGFGMGNYKDGRMEQISKAGNGNYFYIDSFKEAEKVFVKEMRANMFTIAKDVKIQVEFNPLKVKGYRLIGYENRLLANEDFANDIKDAGELGAGHTVTALYEIILPGSSQEVPEAGGLKYQDTTATTNAAAGNELMTVKLRYKRPGEETSILIEKPVTDEQLSLDNSSTDFRFAAAVAAFGMLLRESQYIGSFACPDIKALAQAARGRDENGYREEFIGLVNKACGLKQKQ